MVYPKKCAGGKANSVDPDQTSPWSSLIWACTLLRPVCPTMKGDHSKFAISNKKMLSLMVKKYLGREDFGG